MKTASLVTVENGIQADSKTHTGTCGAVGNPPYLVRHHRSKGSRSTESQTMRPTKTITASDIGACGCCPYKLYLQKNQGIGKQTTKHLERGNTAHTQYSKQFNNRTFTRRILTGVLLLVLWWVWP